MGGLSASERSDLALAMAEDVVVASLSSAVVESCTVVTSDERVRRGVTSLGAGVLVQAQDRGLNEAFGPGSFQRHLRGGAADLTSFAGQGLRCDVDQLPAIRACAGPGTATRVWMDGSVPALGRV